MNSTIGLLILWGTMTPQLGGLTLNGERDYRRAKVLAVKQQKPLAVFVARGSAGWQQVLRDGVSPEVRQLLSQRYVLVYVDQDNADGRKWAEAFELNGKSGLVLSDRKAELQAFRHEGELTASELGKHLSRFADPAHVATTTISGNAPAYAPAQAFTPAAYQSPYVCHT
jgi:hypothetical protein